MKELTKKILEAGLVDKHLAKMMERWGTLEPGATDLVGRQQVTKESFHSFVDDIEALLDNKEDEGIKETVLDLKVGDQKILASTNNSPGFCYWDEIGDLIVDRKLSLTPGDYVSVIGKNDNVLCEVLNVVFIYVGEEVKAMRISVNTL